MLNTILWDHDGVLVDTEHHYFRATAEVLAEKAGVTLTLPQYQQFHLIESRGSWHLAGDLSEAEILALRDERNARYTERITKNDVMIPGALDLLRQHRARGGVVARGEGAQIFALRPDALGRVLDAAGFVQ